jgi:SAM-dependent methyltransferase
MLRELARRVVNRFLVRPLPQPFDHVVGHCWSVRLAMLTARADTDATPQRSSLILYEDGVPLPTGHGPLEAIRDVGLGRYRHWEDCLFFSTPDNSNPITNGHVYGYSLAPWLYTRRSGDEGDAGLPLNQRRRDMNDRQLREDVEYSLRIGRHYRAAIEAHMPLAGRTILELGPGVNDGVALYLAAHGARPIVVDRFLAGWNSEYHSRFYGLLRSELDQQEPDADTGPLSALLDAGGYPADVIGRYEGPIEELPLPADSVDVVFSNAVLEHVRDVGRVAERLAWITRPGGIGLHQVDFRDHRDFARPLEFLLLDDETHAGEYRRSHGERCNRSRPSETLAAFRAAGFQIIGFAPNDVCDLAYLRRFEPRLRAATRSRYRDCSRDDLAVLSGFLQVRKQSP